MTRVTGSQGKGRPPKPPTPPASATSINQRALAHLVATRVGFTQGADGGEIPWDSVSPALANLAAAHSVTTLAAESSAASLLPEGAKQRLQQFNVDAKGLSMRRLSVQTQILSELFSTGIQPLVLKGLALSAFAYGDWAARNPSADLDLLVEPQELATVERTLVSMGFAPWTGKASPSPGGRLARYSLWLHHERLWVSEDFGYVDVHWRALAGGAHWNSASALIDRAQSVALPQGNVRTLGAADYLIMACAQGLSDHWSTLKRLADAAAVWQACTPDEIQEAAHRSNLVTSSLRQIESHWREIGPPQPPTKSLIDNAGSLWRIRRGSGSTIDAAARSVLGFLLPERRLTRRNETT